MSDRREVRGVADVSRAGIRGGPVGGNGATGAIGAHAMGLPPAHALPGRKPGSEESASSDIDRLGIPCPILRIEVHA